MLTISKRPRKYSEMIGNETTLTAFKKYTKSNTFPQVVMLSGMSGTGKSCLGYLEAMSLSCTNPKIIRGSHREPCGECEHCQDIISERFSLDVSYKDASAMGKDEVLALEEDVARGPMFGDNKIVIIEEAQQLNSKAAKGALLKLLEKPRKNVFFILLTMDDSVFEKAIKDRCSIFKFKKHKPRVVGDYLMSILEEVDEDESLPESIVDVITAIADNCDGSIRKALQDFQRCLDSEIYTEDMLVEELEIVTEKKLDNVLLGLLQGDTKALFEISRKDSVATIMNKMWDNLIFWKKDYMLGSYYSEEYRKKVEHFVSFPNYNKLIETFSEISRNSGGYLKDADFFYGLMKFVEEIKKPVVSSRRRLKE